MLRQMLLRVPRVGAAAGLLLMPLTASARIAADSGSYHFEIGWVKAPVIVNERNALALWGLTEEVIV